MDSPSFPEEILIDILLRVCVKDLLRFKIVCKSWYSLISERKFVNTRLTRFSHTEQDIVITTFQPAESETEPGKLNYLFINAQDLTIKTEQPLALIFLQELLNEKLWLRDSCNGLLLFETYSAFIVYNPITRIYKKLPNSPFHSRIEVLIHDSSVDKYKVFALDDSGLRAQLLTLCEGTSHDEWRVYEEIIVGLLTGFINVSTFTTVKNKLHWVITFGDGVDDEDNFVFTNLIITMDIAKEKFTMTHVPESVDAMTKAKLFHLSEIKGSLCLTIVMDDLIEVLVLVEKHCNEWATSYRINLQSIPNKPEVLRGFLNDKTIVVCETSSDSGGICDLVKKVFIQHEDHFFLYHLRTNDLEYIGLINPKVELNGLCLFYINSLVSWG